MSRSNARSTRREFIVGSAKIAALGAVIPGNVSAEVLKGSTVRIKSAVRREDTVIRLGGDGYFGDISWTKDDRQLVTSLEGPGWPEIPKGNYPLNQMHMLSGDPNAVKIADVPDYPFLSLYEITAGISQMYYGFGTLAIDDTIYQFLSGPSAPFMPGIAGRHGFRMEVVKLIYSKDNGRTWSNQDGSTPVVWESQLQQTVDKMVFVQEPQDTFCWPRMVQMGRGYQDNTDGYVYIHSPNGNADGTMNQLVMLRVPKRQMLDRKAYEYFSGANSRGRAQWSHDILERKPIHEFPRGWVNFYYLSFSWNPSIVYNAPLGVYMMVSSGFNSRKPGSGGKGLLDGGPNYLGIWVAPNPWGPWHQISEERRWLIAGDSSSRPFEPVIPPKWISKDGRSFWVAWSEITPPVEEPKLFSGDTHYKVLSERLGEGRYKVSRRRLKSLLPYWGFSMQRVDLAIGGA